MYNEILYPTDGSEGAKAALHSVRDLAATYEATVHILYVAKQPEIHGLASDTEVDSAGGMVGDPTGGGPGMRGDRTKDDEVKKRAEEQGGTLVESVAEQFEGIETRPVVEWGEPYESVLDYADEHDIDIIVMGTHGRTGLDHHLLGSVTEKVVRTSDVPVLTVRASGEK